MSLYPEIRKPPKPKTREELVVDMALLIQSLLTIANLTQNEAVNAEVAGALKAVGISIGGAETP